MWLIELMYIIIEGVSSYTPTFFFLHFYINYKISLVIFIWKTSLWYL